MLQGDPFNAAVASRTLALHNFQVPCYIHNKELFHVNLSPVQ